LYAELRKQWVCEIINGEVGAKERNRIFEGFQRSPASDPHIIIADPQTMAHGLDLWQAQTVIWYGITDKPELYAQANRRAHRPGQKFPVTVVQIVSNKLEQEVFRRLENNLSLQGTLLDMVRTGQL
jgi:SNF2 family DNA or RNA helicase